MNKYDILEKCLHDLEQGQTVDAILARYPDQACELRPLLETAIQSRTLGGAPIPNHFLQRDRNRLIRRAAEMRESSRIPHRRMIPLFPRLAITLGVVGALVLSSTGLVNASGSSIPGDQLYPVKRTWEGVRLMFVFTPQGRDILESQYDQERLNEIDELLNMGRNATPISFSGLVTRQQDGSWTVSGIPVSVNDSTILPQEKITDSAPVFVIGITRSDGAVEAHQIQLLQPGAPLPPFEPSGSGEHGNLNPASTPIISSTPDTSATQSSEPGHSHTTYDFSGIVESMQDGIWTINGQPVHVDQNQVRGNVQIGSAVKFQGYYDSNGEFIVSNLDVTSNGDSATSHHNNNSNGNGSGSTTQGSGGDSGNGGGTPTGGSGDH